VTPQQFAKKWKASTLKERSAAQEHFIDLCHLIGEKTPAEADPEGTWYCFEKGAKKTGGGDGWADVWRNGCFAWEYKGKHKDLNVAFAQLQRYAIALQNPPLLVVSDMERILIYTNFTNTVQEIHSINVAELDAPGAEQGCGDVREQERRVDRRRGRPPEPASRPMAQSGGVGRSDAGDRSALPAQSRRQGGARRRLEVAHDDQPV
jgi:hypothetical protein